jgi:hypothetical protein
MSCTLSHSVLRSSLQHVLLIALTVCRADRMVSHSQSSTVAHRGVPAQSAEEVISRSGLDAAAVAGFLFENYAEYVDNCAIADASSAASSLSDAVYMIQRRSDGTCGVILLLHT